MLREPLPTVFVRDTMLGSIFLGLVVPAAFVILDLSNISLLSDGAAGSIVPHLAFLWPLLGEQHDHIRIVRGTATASNYVAFFGCMVAFSVALIVFGLRKYSRNRESIRRPDIVIDSLVVLFGAAIYFLASRHDVIDPKSYAPFALNLDQIGLFYFRQYIVFMTLWLSTLVAMVSLIWLFDPRAGSNAPQEISEWK